MPRLKRQQPAPLPSLPSIPPVSLVDKAALTVPETAEILSLGQTTVRQLIATGRVKPVRVGRALIVPRTEIDQFLAREAGARASAPLEAQILRALADTNQDIAIAKRHGANLTTLIAAVKLVQGGSGS